MKAEEKRLLEMRKRRIYRNTAAWPKKKSLAQYNVLLSEN